MKRLEKYFFVKFKVYAKQNGQILLIVVLTMIVALTVGLSIASRIVTELKLSKQNEESQRAFQAAEAGIEQTLKSQAPVSVANLGNNSSFTTTINKDNGAALVLNNGQEVDQALGADVWLSDYPTFQNPMGTGNPVTITMYWGSLTQKTCSITGGSNVAPAIEVILLKGPVLNPTIQKNVYEASGCGSTRIANAVVSSSSNAPYTPILGGPQFQYAAQLTFNGVSESNGLIMKVIPIFNSTIIGFQSTTVFPGQGSIVTSTGNSGSTVRKVVYYQSFPQMPIEVFPYSLLSQ